MVGILLWKPQGSMVIDDRHELWGEPGTLVKLANIEENKLSFYLDSVRGEPLTLENYPKEFNPKVRRWDSDGPLNIHYGYIELEDGVELKFDEPGSFQTGDFWTFSARTSTNDLTK